MRHVNSIHIPHFQHFSARDKLGAHSIEITMTLAILFGLLIALGRRSSLKEMPRLVSRTGRE